MEQIKQITSINNDKIKYFSSLLDKKTRNKERLFLVEGHHLIDEVFKTSFLKAVISSDKKQLNMYKNVEKYLVTEAIIEKLSTTKKPQNILGVVKMLNHLPVLLDKIVKKEFVKLVILDDINDPGNLGTIIRTTAALGYDAIIISNNTVDLYNEKTIRATQGVLFKIPIIKCELNEIISYLKDKNIKCYGTSLKNSKLLDEIEIYKRYAICFGNEARGVSNNLLELMDENVRIEMNNDVESLNVSVASSIIMYEFSRKV